MVAVQWQTPQQLRLQETIRHKAFKVVVIQMQAAHACSSIVTQRKCKFIQVSAELVVAQIQRVHSPKPWYLPTECIQTKIQFPEVPGKPSRSEVFFQTFWIAHWGSASNVTYYLCKNFLEHLPAKQFPDTEMNPIKSVCSLFPYTIIKIYYIYIYLFFVLHT